MNLPFVLVGHERTVVERTETAIVVAAPERTETERTLILAIETQANVVLTPEVAHISTPMLKPASTIASQDIPATLTTARTLLLLTSCLRFDKIATEANSEYAKSSAGHTEKLRFEEPSTADILPNAVEVQLDLILANQRTIMANQH